MIENVPVAESSSLARARGNNRESILAHGMIRSHRLILALSNTMLSGIDSGTLLHIITVLRAMAKLGMLKRDLDGTNLIRQLLTYLVLLTAKDIQLRGMESRDDEDSRVLREAAVQLAVSITVRARTDL